MDDWVRKGLIIDLEIRLFSLDSVDSFCSQPNLVKIMEELIYGHVKVFVEDSETFPRSLSS